MLRARLATLVMMIHNYNCLLFVIIPASPMTDVNMMLKSGKIMWKKGLVNKM